MALKHNDVSLSFYSVLFNKLSNITRLEIKLYSNKAQTFNLLYRWIIKNTHKNFIYEMIKKFCYAC